MRCFSPLLPNTWMNTAPVRLTLVKKMLKCNFLLEKHALSCLVCGFLFIAVIFTNFLSFHGNTAHFSAAVVAVFLSLSMGQRMTSRNYRPLTGNECHRECVFIILEMINKMPCSFTERLEVKWQGEHAGRRGGTLN